LRNLRAQHQIDPNFKPFTSANTLDAINAAKSLSATGPDGLTAIHLKHLGPKYIDFLTCLFNLSVDSEDLPSVWKAATIIQVLKPVKSAGKSASYRPISLLSMAAKTLERLLLPFITEALPKSCTQHGFGPVHLCTTALLSIVTRVAIGFNDAKPARRLVLCTIDISKAFDCIDHTLLMEQISESVLHPNLVR
jgi:hypothetical protein